jgi:hypothetical protein
MKYNFDNDSEQTIDLTYYDYQNNNNYFQSGGSNFSPTTIDLSSLSNGEHTLTVYFADYDNLQPTLSVTATFYILKGKGTEDEPYEIQSENDLNALAVSVNNGNEYNGTYFKLTADLTYDNTITNNFTPIGTGTETEDVDKPFRGHFDGDGHTISGIRYDNSTSYGVGVFGYIYWPATIKNLNVEDCSFNANSFVGGIVGNNGGSSNNTEFGIFDCTVGSDVYVTGTDEVECEAGGIIGNCSSMTIRNCTSKANVSGSSIVGGIAGGYDVSSNMIGVIEDCYYLGNTSFSEDYKGVIVGFNGLSGNSNVGTFNIILLNDDSEATVENSTRISNYNGMTVNATLDDRTLYQDASWNTICLPFDVTISGSVLNGATLKELDTEANEAYEHVTGYENGTLYLNFMDATSIEAGKPYIIKWTSGSGLTGPTFENVEISNTTTESVAVTSADGYVTFTGLYAPRSFSSADNTVLYLGGSNTLYYPSPESGSTMTIGAFRAVFDLNNDLVAGDLTSSEGTETGQSIRAFNLNFGGEGTGIMQIVSDEAQSASGWYTIDGRKLMEQPTKKGIYVKEGQKVMIK